MTDSLGGKELAAVRAELVAAAESFEGSSEASFEGSAARSVEGSAAGSAEDVPALSTYVARGADLDSANMSRVEFAADVATEVTADLLSSLRNLVGRELLPYDPSYQPSAAQALVTDLADIPTLQRLHALALGDDVPVDGPGGALVHAMAHRLHRAESVVTAYRVKGAGIATRRPRGLRALLPRDGVYVRVDEELLYYEPRVDAWVTGDHVLVSARTTLEQRLHAPAKAQAMAREVFATVTAGVAIQGSEELAAAVASDPVMIAKMASLARSLEADPDFAAHLTTGRLVAFVEDHPQYGVLVAGEGEDRRLVFEPSPQTRYRLVKLLADDFLRSDLTQRHYEAGSKQRITGS